MVEMTGFNGWRIPQQKSEIDRLCELMRQENVTSYLEIGLQRATTFHYVATQCPFIDRLVGIDLPNAEWGVADGEECIEAVMADLRAAGREAVFINGDSHAERTQVLAEALGPFDMVFIDADHRYEHALSDWMNYRPMSRKLVAFHDIDTPNFPRITETKLAKYGVWKLWREIREDHRHVEFIDGGMPGMGIGVAWLGD